MNCSKPLFGADWQLIPPLYGVGVDIDIRGWVSFHPTPARADSSRMTHRDGKASKEPLVEECGEVGEIDTGKMELEIERRVWKEKRVRVAQCE